MLSYAPGSGHLATRALGTDNPEIDDTNANFNFRHYVRAVYSRVNSVLFHHEYATIGMKQLLVNVSNDYLPGSAHAQSYELQVLEGINVTMIDNGAYGVTNEIVQFSLLAQSG